MINKVKTFAIAILATGATVAATSASAATHIDTNTFTNVIQDVTISLTVYSNAPIKSSTSQTGEKPVTVTTKSVIAALSNAAPNIPSLVGFDWGKSPQLVLDTVFMATNSPIYTTNTADTNTAALGTSNANTLEFIGAADTNTVTIADTNGSAIITNNMVGTNGGTNLISTTGTWTFSEASISTNVFTYTGNSGSTNSGAFPTNGSVWTVITAATNGAGGTNVTAVTYSNYVSGTATNYVTNFHNVEIQGGTATSPTFADVSQYVYDPSDSRVIITAVGTDLGTTNANYTSGTSDSIEGFTLRVFGTGASTTTGDNLELGVSGFAKETFSTDVLLKSKTKGTNEVPVTSFTANVSGSGWIGGSYTTNTSLGTNGTATELPATEYTGIGSVTNTNFVSGSITNPINPVVIQGTISVGAPKSVAQ
ncbi:MAG: hypothetical protein ACLQU4_16250 [Limisphaerales bacterium]